MNKLKEMNGQEVWTNAFGDRFGERVCVLIEYPNCVKEGIRFKPTREEIESLWGDLIIQEFGSKEALSRELEAEFGVKAQ